MADKAIFGRPAGYRLEIGGDFAQSVCYTYGTDGRMDTITVTNAQGRSVSVGYDWEQGRLAGCAVRNAAGSPLFSRTQTRALRRPALVTTVTNAGVQPLTSNLSPLTFSYAYDAVGRPVTRDADAFAYNVRGEVVSATIGTNAATYAYDGIGNRLTSVDTHGARTYAANALNEYDLAGTDVPDYDEDGNLILSDGRQYAWDAENRLVSVGPADPQTGDLRSEFSYDWQSRRIGKTSWVRAGDAWQPIETRVFVYDDWNLIREIRSDSATGSSTEIDYFWGSDLSGSLQGAGGVGGLVAVSIGSAFYFPGYDNNGNVIGYWDESGTLVAEYVYDAFGNTISSSGSMASTFPHRFSTKYYDAETDLYYYGYRYYSPSLGRWISRDPIEEDDCLNLYLYLRNNSETRRLVAEEVERQQEDLARIREIVTETTVPGLAQIRKLVAEILSIIADCGIGCGRYPWIYYSYPRRPDIDESRRWLWGTFLVRWASRRALHGEWSLPAFVDRFQVPSPTNEESSRPAMVR